MDKVETGIECRGMDIRAADGIRLEYEEKIEPAYNAGGMDGGEARIDSALKNEREMQMRSSPR